jgi:hypothetical protein
MATATKIKFGNFLDVTDEGLGVIRVDSPTKVFATGHTWAIPGALAALTLPPIFVPEAGAQDTRLIGARAMIGSGTSIAVQVRRNGIGVGSPIVVTTTAATTAFAQALIDTDTLGLVLSSPIGAPTDLSVTLLLEHHV